MLYNAEIWTVKQQDIKALESANFRMLRSILNLREDDAHMSKRDVLDSFELPSIADFLSQKRIRWVGHALRRNDNDGSKVAVLKTLRIAESSWTKLIRSDCSKLKISFESLQKLAMDRNHFRSITHWRTFNSLG